jgi:hypothetical protein
MGISKPITLFVISAMMLALPEFLQVANETVGVVNSVAQPGSIGELSKNLNDSMSQIIGVMSYIMGIMFGIKGALALKEYSEYGGGPRTYSSSEKKPEIAVPVAKVNLNKEAKIAVDKVEPIKDMFKKEKLYDYDFEDKDLNELGVQIQSKVKYLKNHSFLQKDMESLLMVENTEKEYLSKIHQDYIEVPFSKRGNKKMENSPYSLASRQLELLLKGLDEIENKIVNHNVMNQKANEIFLKQKVASM